MREVQGLHRMGCSVNAAIHVLFGAVAAMTLLIAWVYWDDRGDWK